MAGIFARHIKSIGHTPIVYGIRDSLAEELGVVTESSVEGLLKNADCAVVGGGGLFTNAAPAPGTIFEEFRNDLYRFVNTVEKNGIPFVVCSVGGGEAISVHSPFHFAVARMISSKMLRGLSLRRYRDRGILDECSAKGGVHQDVALCLGDFFKERSVRPVDGAPCRIGLSVYDRPSDVRLVRLLEIVSKVRGSVSIHLLDAYSGGSPHKSEFIHGFPNVPRIEYGGLVQYLRDLSGLDLVITCKLHIAVAALAMGVPAVSWGGSSKAHSFFDDIDFKDGIISNVRADRLRFVRSMLDPERAIGKLRESMPLLDSAIESAKGHLNLVTEFLGELSLSHCSK